MPEPARPTPPKTGRCPRCGKSYAYASIAAHKPFPFCSPRCRDVDLGNWLSGKYAVPGAPVSQEPGEGGETDDAT